MLHLLHCHTARACTHARTHAPTRLVARWVIKPFSCTVQSRCSSPADFPSTAPGAVQPTSCCLPPRRRSSWDRACHRNVTGRHWWLSGLTDEAAFLFTSNLAQAHEHQRWKVTRGVLKSCSRPQHEQTRHRLHTFTTVYSTKPLTWRKTLLSDITRDVYLCRNICVCASDCLRVPPLSPCPPVLSPPAP